MKKACLIFTLLFSSIAFSQTKLLSWNIENFGKSKSNQEIIFIANIIKDYDIVTIQELVVGYGGDQGVEILADRHN